MPSADDYRALLARLREGKGADREIDADILLRLGILTRRNLLAGCPGEEPAWEYLDVGRHTTGDVCIRPVSGSIDAALALVERVLPDGRAAKDILADALGRMGREGWRPDLPLSPQIARYVLIELLTAFVEGGAEHVEA